MHAHGSIQNAFKTRSILEPLGLWDPVVLNHVAAPRAPPQTTRWAVDALDGSLVALERETHPRAMPNARLPRPSRTLDDDVPAPNPGPSVQALDDQLVMVIDDPDPWAHHWKPIFWSD